MKPCRLGLSAVIVILLLPVCDANSCNKTTRGNASIVVTEVDPGQANVTWTINKTRSAKPVQVLYGGKKRVSKPITNGQTFMLISGLWAKSYSFEVMFNISNSTKESLKCILQINTGKLRRPSIINYVHPIKTAVSILWKPPPTGNVLYYVVLCNKTESTIYKWNTTKVNMTLRNLHGGDYLCKLYAVNGAGAGAHSLFNFSIPMVKTTTRVGFLHIILPVSLCFAALIIVGCVVVCLYKRYKQVSPKSGSGNETYIQQVSYEHIAVKADESVDNKGTYTALNPRPEAAPIRARVKEGPPTMPRQTVQTDELYYEVDRPEERLTRVIARENKRPQTEPTVIYENASVANKKKDIYLQLSTASTDSADYVYPDARPKSDGCTHGKHKDGKAKRSPITPVYRNFPGSAERQDSVESSTYISLVADPAVAAQKGGLAERQESEDSSTYTCLVAGPPPGTQNNVVLTESPISDENEALYQNVPRK